MVLVCWTGPGWVPIWVGCVRDLARVPIWDGHVRGPVRVPSGCWSRSRGHGLPGLGASSVPGGVGGLLEVVWLEVSLPWWLKVYQAGDGAQNSESSSSSSSGGSVMVSVFMVLFLEWVRGGLCSMGVHSNCMVSTVNLGVEPVDGKCMGRVH